MAAARIDAKLLVCGECCEVFDTKDKLVDHLSSVHGTGLVICQICREIFSTEEESSHTAQRDVAPLWQRIVAEIFYCARNVVKGSTRKKL